MYIRPWTKLAIIWIFFSCVYQCFAGIPLMVKIEDFSKSGKTMSINRGFIEDLQAGDWGKFYLKRGDLNRPKLFLLAEGELVKSLPKRSYWLIKKVYIESSFLPQTETYLITQNQVTQGRQLRISKKDVFHDGEESEISELTQLGKEYQSGEQLFDQLDKNDDERKYTDLKVTTFGAFKIKKGIKNSEEYGDELNEKIVIENRVVPIGDLKKKEDQIIFQKVTDGHELSLSGKIKKFGITQSSNREMETSKGMTYSHESIYRKKLEEINQSKHISPRVRAKIVRDDVNWTSDMDDDKLRRYFIASGIEREYQRRELALNEADGHEVTFKYQNSLSSHTTAEDPSYRGGSYNLSLSYDFHLSQFSRNMKKWSLEIGLETGIASYDLGGMNGRANELVYGSYLNFYFLNGPLSLNTFNCLIGIGLKNGMAKISNYQLTSVYSYQLTIIPALQLLAKYRFRPGDLSEDNVKIGMSVNFGAAVDFKTLSLKGNTVEDINSKISVTDLKYIAGVSFYF